MGYDELEKTVSQEVRAAEWMPPNTNEDYLFTPKDFQSNQATMVEIMNSITDGDLKQVKRSDYPFEYPIPLAIIESMLSRY